jgi:hypothetical protein
MEYLIKEKQLFDIIYKFIDNMLTEDNIEYQDGYNYDTGKWDENLLNFFGDKYLNNKQDDWYFEYVRKEYYERLYGHDSVKKKWLDKSPLLEVMEHNFNYKLTVLFGDYWKPVFEQWFKDKYPELPVKTFIFKN